MPKHDLLNLCSPPALDGQGRVATTLGTWTKLGLFKEIEAGDGPETSLSEQFQELSETPDAEFRSRLRTLVFAPENNPNLEDRDGAGDFTRALSWLLATDVYSLPTNRDEVIALDASYFRDTVPPFKNNNNNWPAFPGWAAFLGFGWTSARGIELDPTTAIRDALDDVFSVGAREVPIGTFVTSLAREIPVLDGGVYRLAVEQQLTGWRRLPDTHLSIGLSRALIRLRSRDTLRLERRGDAGRMMQLLGPGGRFLEDVSHVIRVEAVE